MIDAHVKDLINMALDGELNESQTDELNRHLAQSREAQDYHTSLTELNSFLEAVPPQELPAGLHDQIMSRVHIPRSSSRPSGLKRLFSLGQWPELLRYGAATAAGLLIAVMVYETQPQLRDFTDTDQMVGTLVPARDATQVKVVDQLTFELDQLSGSATLEQRNEALVLDVQIEADEPVEINVSVVGGSLKFEALAQSQSNFESFEFADQMVRARGLGRQGFAVLLNRVGDNLENGEQQIKLEYWSDGELLHEAMLGFHR